MMLAVCAPVFMYASRHVFDIGQISMVSFNLMLKLLRLSTTGEHTWMRGR